MNRLELNAEGHLLLSGKLDYVTSEKSDDLIRLARMNRAEMVEMVEGAIALHNKLGEDYNKFLKNDGKLIGQEKADLLRELERMINTLICIRVAFQYRVNRQMIVSSSPGEHGFGYTMKCERGNYYLNGEINKAQYNQLSSFKNWYKLNLTERLNGFLSGLQNSLADKDFAIEEAIDMASDLDGLIQTLALITFKVRYAEIHY